MMRNAGFTLIELMTTITVLGILLAVGTPSMRDLVQSNRVATQVNELVGVFTLARNAAIHRTQSVSVCAGVGREGSAPYTRNWRYGAELRTGTACPAPNAASGAVATPPDLRVASPLRDVALGHNATATVVTFDSNGFLTGTYPAPAGKVLEFNFANDTAERWVCISRIGLPTAQHSECNS